MFLPVPVLYTRNVFKNKFALHIIAQRCCTNGDGVITDTTTLSSVGPLPESTESKLLLGGREGSTCFKIFSLSEILCLPPSAFLKDLLMAGESLLFVVVLVAGVRSLFPVLLEHSIKTPLLIKQMYYRCFIIPNWYLIKAF